jgi:hypothetical protein
VSCLGVTEDGMAVCTGSWDSFLKIWNWGPTSNSLIINNNKKEHTKLKRHHIIKKKKIKIKKIQLATSKKKRTDASFGQRHLWFVLLLLDTTTICYIFCFVENFGLLHCDSTPNTTQNSSFFYPWLASSAFGMKLWSCSKPRSRKRQKTNKNATSCPASPPQQYPNTYVKPKSEKSARHWW